MLLIFDRNRASIVNEKVKFLIKKFLDISSEIISSEKHETEVLGCGLRNKGNTCYINATLQCLNNLAHIWSNLFLDNNTSPFLKSFLRIMSMLRSSRTAVDPSQFLRHLRITLIKSGKNEFNIFQQQDAAEILTHILNEFYVELPQIQQFLFSKMRNETTCNFCHESTLNEDSVGILQLPVSNSIQSSLNKALQSEELTDVNSFFCSCCSAYREASVHHYFCGVGRYLIIQLKRFIQQGNNIIKDTTKVECTSNISVPVVDGEVTIYSQFHLIGTINHTGNLNRGHYTAFTKFLNSGTWKFYNDAAVIDSVESSINNSSSYLYFYEAC